MKFGVFGQDFSREFVSGKNLQTINHYEGQLLISDGEYSKVIDDFTLESIERDTDVLMFIAKAFEEEKQSVEVAQYYYAPDQDEEHRHQFYINGKTARVTHFCKFPALPK